VENSTRATESVDSERSMDEEFHIEEIIDLTLDEESLVIGFSFQLLI